MLSGMPEAGDGEEVDSQGRRQPLRVLHVVEASLGGVRRYIEDVVAASRLRPWTCALAYSEIRADAQFASLLDTCRGAGWSLFPVSMSRKVALKSDLAAAGALWRVLGEFQPDVVHCHSSKAGALGRVVASLRRHRPLRVFSPHASGAHLGQPYRMIERVLSVLASDVVLAVSASELAELQRSLSKRPSASVAWPVIDGMAFAPREQGLARRQVALPEGRPVVLAVGRLSAQKNPLLFAEVVAAVRKTCPAVVGVWVGDGELRQDLEVALDRLVLRDAFIITGWCTDVRPYLAACDVVVMTSLYESFGYVTAEALAMERPVVGTRVAGTVDLIEDGVSGALFEPGDVASAAAAVARLLSSPALRTEAGRHGRGFVLGSFSSERLAAELESAYQLREAPFESRR